MTTTCPLNAFIAASDAVKATADRSGPSIETRNVMVEALTVADFAFEVARAIAQGRPLDAPEVADHFRWAVMKMVELNELMPEPMRADLSYECFMPVTPEAAAH